MTRDVQMHLWMPMQTVTSASFSHVRDYADKYGRNVACRCGRLDTVVRVLNER